jgi:mediator of RNA polymerase II transcription subunit 16
MPLSARPIVSLINAFDLTQQLNLTECIVMITHDASKRLRLYRITIHWNANSGETNHHKASLSPQLSVVHLELLDRCVPQASERTSSAQLSSLHLEPLSHAIDMSTFTVAAVFTSAAQNHGTKYSIVSRWELQPAETTLHDSFKGLKPTANQPTAMRSVQKLHRLADVFSQKAILTVQSNVYHNTFAFAASDGTVEFRSRETMQIITADGDTNKATSLPQNGFSFMASDCIDMSLSPSVTTSVVMKLDGSIQLHNAEYLHGWKDATEDDGNTRQPPVAPKLANPMSQTSQKLPLYLWPENSAS